jgi:hypothetical protein
LVWIDGLFGNEVTVYKTVEKRGIEALGMMSEAFNDSSSLDILSE